MCQACQRLQKKAWSEIRSNIFCTLQTAFPAELLELVFEWTLVAEEIPLNPMVVEWNMDKPTEQEKHLQAPAVARSRIKQEYRCRAL